MGMAASQARLLSLTSRLHDIELKAQSIESQKIALATQKDELYQNYCDALDATKIQVAFRNDDASVRYVDANFNSLCEYSNSRVKQYALRDTKSGNLIVPEDVYNKAQSYNDKYSFAYAMIGFEENFGWGDEWKQGSEIGIGTALDNYGYDSEGGSGHSLYMTECEQKVYDAHTNDSELTEAFEKIESAEGDNAKREALQSFRDLLYKKYASEIFAQMNIDKDASRDVEAEATENGEEATSQSETLEYPDKSWEDFEREFNYYVRLFEAIEDAGGCQPIEKQYQSGESGTEWFKNMVEAGLITIQVFEGDGADADWIDTNVATSTNENYLQEVQDETDLKRAEAEYEYELDKINQKDSKYDTDLSKLETERSSITTEMDSLKQVRDDNVERTFGIFS